MQITKYIAMAMLGVLLLGGCRSHRDATTTPHANTDTGTGTELRKETHYYTANFSCSAMGYSASGQMRMQADSIIWISASKVIELGRATFTNDSVVVYARVMGKCFRGTYNDVYTRFGYRTNFQQLTNMLTSDNAAQQLSDLAHMMGLEAQFKIDPWRETDKLSFPMAVPENVMPL